MKFATLLKEIERDFDTWFKQHRQQPESLATALLEHATREADDIEVIIINPVANDRQTGGYQRCQAN